MIACLIAGQLSTLLHISNPATDSMAEPSPPLLFEALNKRPATTIAPMVTTIRMVARALRKVAERAGLPSRAAPGWSRSPRPRSGIG